jgi:hypothetical protein
MVRIKRMIPGELEGDVNPEDFGIQVIKIEKTPRKEAAARMGKMYAEAREVSKIADPRIEKFIGELATGATHISKVPRGFKFRLRRVA